MDFVNPLLLAGAAAAVAPIVLHLIMRQKPKQLLFPAIRFVRQRRESNRRKMRLRQWLLLTLRVAALCLLAFALARPSMNASGIGSNRELPVAAALVFDTSPRMQYRHQNQTRLDAAREMADWLLGRLPEASQVAVLESSLGSAVFQIDLGAAKQRIQRLETTYVPHPLISVAEEGLELLSRTDKKRKELYIFTDLTRAAWTDGSSTKLAERLAQLKDVGVYVIDVGVAQPRDTSLGEIRLSSQVLPESGHLTVATDITRVGPGSEHTLQLWLNDAAGKAQKRGETTIDLSKATTAPVEFAPFSLEKGIHQGHARIVGEDGLASDNTRYFTVEVRPPWKILIAAPDPSEQSSFFFREAIAPDEFRKTGQARFEYELVSLDKLANLQLNKFAAVCVIDPAPLAPAAWRQLAEYATSGGAVGLFLGANSQPIKTFNEPAAQELLPGKLADQARRPDGTHLMLASAAHPLVDRIRRLGDTVPWQAFPVFRYWSLNGLRPEAQVLLSYSDRQPAIIERTIGQGRVVTMTTPVSGFPQRQPWNMLPTGIDAWPFVMLMNETVLYLAGASDRQLNYTCGQTVTIRPDRDQALSTYVLMTPKGDRIRRSADTRSHVIALNDVFEPGNYQLASGDQQEGFRGGFSVNLSPTASQLDRLQPDALKSTFGEYPFRVARTQDEVQRDIALGRVGRELFPILILSVALILGLEHGISNRYYKDA